MKNIKLTEKETYNLKKFKKADIKHLINDAKFILDEFYHDNQMAYLPNVVIKNDLVNPVEDIYILMETIDFMRQKYEEGEWERHNVLYKSKEDKENQELYKVLYDLKLSLKNALEHAIENSKFKKSYKNLNDAYQTTRKKFPYFYEYEKLNNEIFEQNGLLPIYSNGKIDYSYYLNYKGSEIHIGHIEKYKNKELLNKQIIKTKIDRGY